MKSPLALSASLFLLLTAATVSAQVCSNPAGSEVTVLQPVLGAPFSADLVDEFTRVGRDGSRTHQERHGRIYRDSEGRGRCDIQGAAGKIAYAVIKDPVARVLIGLNLEQKTATVTHFPDPAKQSPRAPSQNTAPTPTATLQTSNKHREEALGDQEIEGFVASGKRYSNTNAAGQVSISEDWYSADLKITLLSVHDGSRIRQVQQQGDQPPHR